MAMFHAEPNRSIPDDQGNTPYIMAWGERQPCTVDHRDWTVRVWDSVAGHYTACHSLTPAQIAYACRTAWPRLWAARKR